MGSGFGHDLVIKTTENSLGDRKQMGQVAKTEFNDLFQVLLARLSTTGRAFNARKFVLQVWLIFVTYFLFGHIDDHLVVI